MADDTSHEAPQTSESKFYRGTIVKLFRGSQSGIVRSSSGRDVPFTFIHLVMVGSRRRFEDLREGMSVGYDVGWTSKGLLVTMLRPEG
jgi:hypothetical protein